MTGTNLTFFLLSPSPGSLVVVTACRTPPIIKDRKKVSDWIKFESADTASRNLRRLVEPGKT